jgi:adenosylhomocysteine nucleosidase
MRRFTLHVTALIVVFIFVFGVNGFSEAIESSSIKTGIIGAMVEEVATLQDELTDDIVQTIGGMEFHDGKLDGSDVVVVKCNVGKVNAAVCTQILIDIFHADQIINTGVAGSLNADINIGDIVVSTDAVQHHLPTNNSVVPFSCIMTVVAARTRLPSRLESKYGPFQ